MNIGFDEIMSMLGSSSSMQMRRMMESPDNKWTPEALFELARSYDYVRSPDVGAVAWIKMAQEHPDFFKNRALPAATEEPGKPLGQHLAMSGLPLPDEFVDAQLNRPKDSQFAYEKMPEITVSKMIAAGGLTPEQRKRAVDRTGWVDILFHQYDSNELKMSPDEVKSALAQAMALPAGNSKGTQAVEELFRRQSDKLGKDDFDKVFGSPTPWAKFSAAIAATPYEEHHRSIANSAIANVRHLVSHNRHVSSSIILDAIEKHGGHDLAKRALDAERVHGDPILRSKIIDMATQSSYSSQQIGEAVVRDRNLRPTLTPTEIEKIFAAHPALKDTASPQLTWAHPDVFSKGKLNVAFNTNKLRQVRDLLTERGIAEAHPKDLPPGDWKAGRTPQGSISAQKLQDAIDSAPRSTYNWTEGIWDRGQQHSDEASRVLQVNATTDHINRMKQAGIYDTFKKMYDMTRRSGHPVGPAGIGWVRWTGGHDGIFIDEVQSDFGQSFAKKIEAEARRAVEAGRMTQEEADAHVEQAKKDFPEEHTKPIADILFNGKHSSEVLQEAFHEWMRQPKTFTSCSNCGSLDVVNSPYAEESGKICRDCQTEQTPESVAANTKSHSFVGVPVHIWTPEAKKPLSHLDMDKPLPGHFLHGYGEVPKKMGFKPGKYGELPTQNNEDLKDKVVGEVYTCPHCAGPINNMFDNHTREVVCPKCAGVFGLGFSSVSLTDESGTEHPIQVWGSGDIGTPAAKTWKDKIRKSEDPNAPKAVSVWVENWKGEVLWGLRQKGGWTLPGGHIEPGEDPETAAIRETYEECGLTPSVIHEIGVANGGPHGDIPVYMYRAVAKGQPTSANDPDHEVSEWRWVDCSNGVPAEILGNLAHDRNVVLQYLGMQNQMQKAEPSTWGVQHPAPGTYDKSGRAIHVHMPVEGVLQVRWAGDPKWTEVRGTYNKDSDSQFQKAIDSLTGPAVSTLFESDEDHPLTILPQHGGYAAMSRLLNEPELEKAEKKPKKTKAEDPYPMPEYKKFGPKNLPLSWERVSSPEHILDEHPLANNFSTRKNSMLITNMGKGIGKMVGAKQAMGLKGVHVNPELPYEKDGGTIPAYYDMIDNRSYLSPRDAHNISKLMHFDETITPHEIQHGASSIDTMVHEMFHAASAPHDYQHNEERALEEATTEVLAQHYSPEIMPHSIGLAQADKTKKYPPLFICDSDGTVALNRHTAYTDLVSRFGSLIAHIDDLNYYGGETHDHKISKAAAHVAMVMKRLPGHWVSNTDLMSPRRRFLVNRFLDKKVGIGPGDPDPSIREGYEAARQLVHDRLFGHSKDKMSKKNSFFHRSEPMTNEELDKLADDAGELFNKTRKKGWITEL